MRLDHRARLTAARDDWPGVATIAHAAADLLTASAAAWEGRRGGPLTTAAELFDRASHEPTPPTPARTGERGYHLWAVARLVTLIGELSGDKATAEAIRLVLALAALAETFAELRRAHDRPHQTQATRAAATLLRTFTPPASGDAAPTVHHQPRHAQGKPHVGLRAD